ncbi:Protein of unknown function (DUF998) [Thermoplasmatales archaeon BRNA1]|nr:Protein of unknown function (DUF998) [Thermoplasmatales archaeon BRNA1]
MLCLTAPIVFSVLWVLSATIDGDWTFGEDSLSRMGISENRIAAALFNGGCVFVGAMGFIVGIGIMSGKDPLSKPEGIAYSAGMVFLMLVGVFPMDLGTIHNTVATTFGVFVFIAILLASAVDYRNRDHPEIDVIVLAFTVIMLATQRFEVWEPLLVIATMVWTAVLGLKMRLSA